MPITSFTIDGVEVDPLYQTFEIRETIGEIATLVCDIESIGSPVERFSLRSVVEVKEGGITLFGGRITQLRERGFGGPNVYDSETGAEQIVTSITVEDYTSIAEHVFITETVTAGTTLKAFLTTIIGTYFSSLGVTLSGSQSDGPALPDLSFDKTSGAEVIKTLEQITGYLSRFGPSPPQEFRMWARGDIVALFDIDENDTPARWTGDVEVENILSDEFANRVIVVCNPFTELNHVETFVANGTDYIFPLTYTLTAMRYTVQVNGVDELLTFQGIGFDLAVRWLYYASDNTIRRVISGIPDPPSAGSVISITFDGTFSAYAEAGPPTGTDPADEVTIKIESDNITSDAAAQALADAVLEERLNAGEQKVTYSTRYVEPTLHVGQQQGIEATARGLTGDYLITDMMIRAETPVTAAFANLDLALNLGFIRTITAKKDNAQNGKFQQTYRDWLKYKSGASSAAPSIGPGVPAVVGPAPPDTSVQFNDGGSFGGQPEFLYEKTTATLQLGTLHTPGGYVNLLVGSGHTVI